MTKTYTENRTEEITIYDLAGNSTNKEIKIDNIVKKVEKPTDPDDPNETGKPTDPDDPNETGNPTQTVNKRGTQAFNSDKTLMQTILPKAGNKTLIKLIVIIIILAVAIGIRYRKFKDIK